MRGRSGAALALGAGMLFFGYTVASFGWILIRGWDIPLRMWVSPLHPWDWSQGNPSLIPNTQVYPSGTAGGAGVEGTVPGGLSGGGTNPGPAKGGTAAA